MNAYSNYVGIVSVWLMSGFTVRDAAVPVNEGATIEKEKNESSQWHSSLGGGPAGGCPACCLQLE